MRRLCLLTVWTLLNGFCLGGQPPNVVIILADDLGWADTGCYGADLIETQHIDRLATQSVRFVQAYAPAPVCSPTRAAILTGKAPARLQMTIWSEGSVSGPKNRKLLQGASRHDLPLSEVTLAEHFQKAGYQTSLVGKWHLGDAAHAPEAQGFDINIGGTHWGAPSTFFFPYRGARSDGEIRYIPHLEFGSNGEYLTDRLTQEAIRVIDHSTARQQPFFLMLAHHAPHTPIEARAEDVEYFRGKLRPEFQHQHPVYAAMIRSLDESVGRIWSRLTELGQSENTVFVFTSDNGGYIGSTEFGGKETPITSNAPLRSGKGTCYEGGIRVPLLIRWPQSAVDRVCNEPVLLTDLFPTLLSLLPESSVSDKGDGMNLVTLLRNPAGQLSREMLCFHYPHYYHAPPSTPVSAIRMGDWKLLDFYEDESLELYNLKDDLGEERNVAFDNPGEVQRLRSNLRKWLAETDATLPTRNVAQ